MKPALEAIAAQRVIPVLRSSDPRDAAETVRACARAGMRAVELTKSTPDVAAVVAELAADGLVLGVGTIRDAADIEPMAAAGAAFVVSFGRPEGFVAAAHAAGLEAVPGAMTPTEILSCLADGADAIKLFPAHVLTPRYLRDLAPLFPELRAIATGGLGAAVTSVRPWLQCGAVAVGIGGDLGTVATVGVEEVERRCRAALAAAA